MSPVVCEISCEKTKSTVPPHLANPLHPWPSPASSAYELRKEKHSENIELRKKKRSGNVQGRNVSDLEIGSPDSLCRDVSVNSDSAGFFSFFLQEALNPVTWNKDQL